MSEIWFANNNFCLIRVSFLSRRIPLSQQFATQNHSFLTWFRIGNTGNLFNIKNQPKKKSEINNWVVCFFWTIFLHLCENCNFPRVDCQFCSDFFWESKNLWLILASLLIFFSTYPKQSNWNFVHNKIEIGKWNLNGNLNLTLLHAELITITGFSFVSENSAPH